MNGEKHGVSAFRKPNEALRIQNFHKGKMHKTNIAVNSDYTVLINYQKGKKEGMCIVKVQDKDEGEIKHFENDL